MPKAKIMLSDTAYARIRLAILDAAEHRQANAWRHELELAWPNLAEVPDGEDIFPQLPIYYPENKEIE